MERNGAAWLAAIFLAGPVVACSGGHGDSAHAAGSGYGVGRPSPAITFGGPNGPTLTGENLPETRAVGGNPELRMIANERVRRGEIVPGPSLPPLPRPLRVVPARAAAPGVPPSSPTAAAYAPAAAPAKAVRRPTRAARTGHRARHR